MHSASPAPPTSPKIVDPEPVLHAVLDLVTQDGVKVPPIPAVVARLSDLLKNPECEMREVTALVGTDQALVAHILRCASSSLLAARTQVASLNEAVMRVGTNGLFSLAVSFCMGRDVARSTPLQSLRRDGFRRAAASAEFCRRLAPRHGADPEGAFLCGLLGNFSLTVALGAIEQVLAIDKRLKQSRPAEAWMEIARLAADQIATRVTTQWGMPKLVCEVIAARRSGERDAHLAPYVRLLDIADPLTDLFYVRVAPDAREIAQSVQCDEAEAAEIAAFLPEVAASVWALGSAADDLKMTQSMQIMMVEPSSTTLQGEVVPASIPVTVERKGGPQQLVCTGLATDGFVASGVNALPLNQVVKCRFLAVEEDLELVAYVASVIKDGEYRFEIKPMGLTGAHASKWQKLRSGSAREFSASAALDRGEVPGATDASAAPAAGEAGLDPKRRRTHSTQGGPRQGGYVSLPAKPPLFRRLADIFRGRRQPQD